MTVVYEKRSVEIRDREEKKGPLTMDEAKKLLGWMEEREGDDWGQDYAFRDMNGKKVRLTYNKTNRPFRRGLAIKYMNEMLRGEWALNGETLIFDRMGMVQSGQHRLVGFIFACQAHAADKDHWKQYIGVKEPTLECTLFKGISEKKTVTDTLDLGQRRSFGDVLFRNRTFGNIKEKEQQKMSNDLAGAARLAWLRTGGNTISDAKHFPHSEGLNFIEAHPKLTDAVEFVTTLEGGAGAEGKRISKFVSVGYAAGFMYLMGMAKTDSEKFEAEGSAALNEKLWSKAEEFWTLFAAGANLEKGSPILILRDLLVKMSKSGSGERDDLCAMIVNTWNAWIDGKTVTAKEILPKKKKNDVGKMIIEEMPRIGGLDVVRLSDPGETEEEEAAEGEAPAKKPGKPTAKPKGKAAAKPKGKKGAKKPEYDVNEWVWVFDTDPEAAHWKGQIKSYSENGATAVVMADLDKKEYEVETKNLRADKPE